ncbi:DUF5979 domain-containing protein [Microbacterium sp. p3-SID338]|uniref:DUF5979 domain-containing protein n=1 Tax=unclassified Microbacterium TaxID=2609290 RepID=UPI000C7FC926|nr:MULTISPECIES: DUF5979 domain-containing protein [unclassified Microbacterium]MCT1395988.1 DUF5979 domain-containing protein [Microbacterium sp. p3-SID338]PMC05224.1 hypothetical protein CJ226_06420 [Microbacterium sp. UMB0228]
MASSAVALLALVGLAVPPTAQAAELDAITAVTVVEPTGDIHLYDTLRLEATWAVPDSAQPGDTFSLAFPATPRFVGVAATFPLRDPAGATVGTCTVAATAIACTLSDYVLTHDNVHGTLFFQMKAEETTEEDTVTFTTGDGGPITVEIPGGGVGPQRPEPVPTDATKSGVQTTDGTIEWYIWVPGRLLGGERPTLTDTATPGLNLLPDTVAIGSVATDAWAGGLFDPADFHPLAAGSDFVLTPGDAGSSFTVELTAPAQADRLYRLSYQTALPADAHNGQVFANTVSGSSVTTTTATVSASVAGGDGEGDGRGGFSVAKRIVGEGAPLVPADATFAVDYSYPTADGAVVGTLMLPADGTARQVTQIPAGAVVTLSEHTAEAVPGVVWGRPQFRGAGVTTTEEGARLTIGAGSVVAVELTNPTTLSPPSPSTPPTTAEPPSPSEPTPPPAPPAGLASTGGDISGLFGLTAGAVLALATGVVLRRRAGTRRG